MKTAYIGLAGPVAYDYKNRLRAKGSRGARNPNPILEDVSGLVLLYDEIVFLSRELCPTDMQKLHYVRFLNEDRSVVSEIERRASMVVSEIRELNQGLREPFGPWEMACEQLRAAAGGADGVFLGLDNHGGRVQVGGGGRLSFLPNSIGIENAILDYAISTTIAARSVDVILSTPASSVVRELIEPELAETSVEERQRRALVSEIAMLSSVNVFTGRGSYSEEYSELRENPLLVDFRKYLEEYDVSSVEIQDAAREIERKAMVACKAFAEREATRRPVSRLVGSLATLAIGGALGLVNPTLGHVFDLLSSGVENGKQEKALGAVRWAPFVFDLSTGRRIAARRP